MKNAIILSALLSLSLSSLAIAEFQWPLDEAESVAAFQSLPVVPFQDSFGTGHYLDRVRPSDFPEGTAAFAFVDLYGRTGISLRYIIEQSPEVKDLPFVCGEPGKIYASTIFQRYRNYNRWTIGEHSGARVMVDSVLFAPHTKVKDKFPEMTSRCPSEDGEKELFSASSLVELIAKGSVPLVQASTSLDNICPIYCGIIRLVPDNKSSFWSKLWRKLEL